MRVYQLTKIMPEACIDGLRLGYGHDDERRAGLDDGF